MCHGLLRGGGLNFGDILGAVRPMASSVELALIALVLQLSAIFEAMALDSAVETLVVSWWRIPFALSFLLLIQREGSDVFFSLWPKPDLC